MKGDAVQVRYCGGVTVASPGRSRFHARTGGLGDFIWYGLGEAGWLGEIAKLQPIVELDIAMPPRPEPGWATEPRIPPELGVPRKPGEPGRKDPDGMIRKVRVGPLHGRAAGPGLRLVEAERREQDFDPLEDVLYQCAATAGWLAVNAMGQVVGEIPAVEISLSIPAYEPSA